jgi:hypothetical protein
MAFLQFFVVYGVAAMHCTSSRSPGIMSAATPIVALV